MEDLRVDYLLLRGVKLAKGDKYSFNGREYLLSDEVEADIYSDDCDPNDKYRTITSFAHRKNKGVQPVPDDFPVDVIYDSGDQWKDTANCFDWDLSESHDNVKSWKPDIEELIKQQAQYDKEKLKSDMQKSFDCTVENAGGKENLSVSKSDKMNVYTQEMKDSGEVPTSGMKCKVKNVWLFVGVKSNGLWVMERESDKNLHSFHPREVKPYKSQEEMEFDNKKNELITAVADVIFACVDDNTFDIARAIYEAGHLRELTLPTKEE